MPEVRKCIKWASTKVAAQNVQHNMWSTNCAAHKFEPICFLLISSTNGTAQNGQQQKSSRIFRTKFVEQNIQQGLKAKHLQHKMGSTKCSDKNA